MNSKMKILSILIAGIALGAGGQFAAGRWLAHKMPTSPLAQKSAAVNDAQKPRKIEDVMQEAWKQFDRSMAEERQAMQKLFAAQVPDLDSSWASQDQGRIKEEPDRLVIQVPIQDQHDDIRVEAKDGFLTVTEQAKRESQDEVSNYDSVQSFSVSSAYDTSKMKQERNGQTLVISIPKVSAGT